MNRAGFLSFLLLSGSLSLMAQTDQSQATCGPIGIQARMMDGADYMVKNGQRILISRNEGMQRVLITLNNTKSVEIVSERITIHGIPTPSDPTPVYGTLTRREVDPGQTASLAISLLNVSKFESVELNSVTYADGSSWQPREGEACIVIPHSL